MKALAVLDCEVSFDHYERIVEAKRHVHRSRAEKLRGRVRKAYSRYWTDRAALERLAGATHDFSVEERQLLKDCYSNRQNAVKPLKELMGLIKAHQTGEARTICQYCGIDGSSTFDHYLPKEEFGEFAVCALNLIPCCHVCNGVKGDRWLADAERALIHLYFDQIDTKARYVEACVIEKQGRPGDFRVEYRLDENSESELVRRYHRHCKTLKLLGRFAEHATGHLDRYRGVIADMTEATAEEVAERLGAHARALTPVLGANHWEVALCHAVSQAPCFITYAMREAEAQRHE